ncbi:hypothetical protein SAMN05421493_10285 [Pseudobutyrivibrio sp. 49]|uniref:hypothetical protein n=1 Tax=Pseudobutyrivibrio sp. 49 TaxID=1855344 RepID=UPI000881F9A0|nr:hypothetical protein [Pseudobutyrivibrio sp. 49]SDH59893.1 hypothetical protein SAMN05421493_10285 [Pseudobutyrivibrio sp. 49]
MQSVNNNDRYVIALINGTKEKKLKWERDSQIDYVYPAYCIYNGDQKLVLVKYDTREYDIGGEEYLDYHCRITIIGANSTQLGVIIEDDLNDKGNLWRLYRLVERQVNKFDESIDGFIEGLNRFEQ